MTAKKRDQPHHDLVRQYLPGPILNTMLEIIREIGDPYIARPGLGGMAAYPPSTMAVASRNKEGAPSQYAGYLFAVLTVIKLITELPHSQVFEGHDQFGASPPRLAGRRGLTHYQLTTCLAKFT